MTAHTALRIRPARTHDADEVALLHEICVLTGVAGQDASALIDEPHLLGDVYLGPYLALEPDHCLVLADEDDVPVGYSVGTPDTTRFEARCEELWCPALRERHPEHPDADTSRLDAGLVRTIHHPRPPDPDLVTRFPAHLHIDLLPRAQGGGHGGRLIRALLASLADAGAPGVHLGVDTVNTSALGFYAHVGFTTLRSNDAVTHLCAPLPL